MGDKAAFFYGTLMAPEVLHRVCHGTPRPAQWQRNLLKIRPALLHSYVRHKVRFCDYPAITPTPGSSVRGTLVEGLTEGDIWRLDIFEGNEYTRRKVTVRVLNQAGVEVGEEVEAEAFIWSASPSGLEEGEWDFGMFVREKMGRWVGATAEDEGLQGRKKAHYILEVDAAVRELNGKTDPTGGRGRNGNITEKLEGTRTQEREVLEVAT